MSTDVVHVRSHQCRHIFAEGRRCGSPALRGEIFCYHHHTTRKPLSDARERLAFYNANQDQHAAFDVPMIEDRASILMAVTEILRRVAGNMLDTKRASLLLYALQVANSNLPRQAPDKQSVVYVEEMTQAAELGALAPEAALFLPKPTKSARQIAEEFEEADRARATRRAAERAAAEHAAAA